MQDLVSKGERNRVKMTAGNICTPPCFVIDKKVLPFHGPPPLHPAHARHADKGMTTFRKRLLYPGQNKEASMANNNFQEDFKAVWRSVQNFLRRYGIHPAVAVAGVVLLIIFPRFVIFGLIIYGVYWMYRNGVFKGNNKKSGAGNRGKRGHKGRWR